jgi:hypothetical protein
MRLALSCFFTTGKPINLYQYDETGKFGGNFKIISHAKPQNSPRKNTIKPLRLGAFA